MDDTLMKISKLDFCVTEVTLFLDTHPGDLEALKYLKEATQLLQEMKNDYICKGGSLTNRQSENIDEYINGTFPWDGESKCGYMKNACNFQ